MPVKVSALTAAPRGGFVARKVIPRDVAEAYGARFNDGKPLWEAWFNSGPVKLLQARAIHREWLSEIEGRIAKIESSDYGATAAGRGFSVIRTCGGLPLSPLRKNARARG